MASDTEQKFMESGGANPIKSMVPGTKAPEDAPNVLLVIIDDAGFGGPRPH
jgi:hypothetical protein